MTRAFRSTLFVAVLFATFQSVVLLLWVLPAVKEVVSVHP